MRLVIAVGRFVKSCATRRVSRGRMRAVMSPRMRQRIRLIAGVWLGWTIAGLFYIIQDTVPRLYRGGAVPWKYVFVGWMTGMYVCAALTPALLWLGNRWPIERRVTYAALHLCFSVVFSILATTLEVPILLLLGVFPARRLLRRSPRESESCCRSASRAVSSAIGP